MSRTRAAWSLYFSLYGLSRAILLRTSSYDESTSLNTCARAASVNCWLRSMSMRVRFFSPWLRSKIRSGIFTLSPSVS